jgi:class 3 adenylate cyclase
MSSDQKISDGRDLFRMDFAIKTVCTDDDNRMAYFVIEPDPRRYELITDNGEDFYLDKYCGYRVSAAGMKSAIQKQLAGLPISRLSPSIDSTPEYAAKRRSAIVTEINAGDYVPPEEKATAHRQFEDNPTPRNTVFLSVDICGSSAMRQEDPKAFDRARDILLRELATTVGLFNGSILTPTGDGFIALIDYPAFTPQCDGAVDLGLSLLGVLRDSVSPALEQIGIKPIRIRVGADFGLAEVQDFKVPATGFAKPTVASNALNRAVKIEQSCSDNEFRIGRNLYELIHVQWLERATEVQFDGSLVGENGYKVYRVT